MPPVYSWGVSMKKIMVDDTQLRIHFKAQTKVLDKAIRVVKEFNGGNIRPRKLNCGLFSVIEVSRNERIVIDNGKLNLMTHEQYNNFIARR